MTATPRPAPGVAKAYRFPLVDRLRTPNGIRVIVAPVSRVPLVTIHVQIEAGASAEHPRESGLASIVARGLAEGTASLSGEEVAERFEQLGSSIAPEAGWDVIEFQCTTLGRQFRQALQLASNLVCVPVFRESDVGRICAERLDELIHQRTEPRSTADDELSLAVYSADVREQLPLDGTWDSVHSIRHTMAREWHTRYFGPENTTVIVVGDIETLAVERDVIEVFGSWDARIAKEKVVRTPAVRGPSTHLRPVPGASQSELRIGHGGPPRNTADYFALAIMNAILGGMFGSRINLNLRERHGYTYGAFSRFVWRRNGSTFAVSSAIRTDATLAAIAEVKGEVRRMQDSRVDDAELSLAVDHLAGVFPLRFETTSGLANALAMQSGLDLPPTYFDEYRDRIRAVSAVDVQGVATEYLRPEQLNVVVVGDESLREALENSAGEHFVLSTPAPMPVAAVTPKSASVDTGLTAGD